MTTPGRALPPESPLSMPRQAVNASPGQLRHPPGGWRNLPLLLSRIFLLVGTVGLSGYGVHEMYQVMARQTTALQWLFLLLFAVNFSWISFAACQSVLGVLLRAAKTLPSAKSVSSGRDPQTAILVPVYNEEPHRVAAALRVMAGSLTQLAPGRFAFFILSDSNQPGCWLGEEAVFLKLLSEVSSIDCPIYYRKRLDNAERKAGNVGDWVQRWGGGYEYMLVLDADSLMGAEAMLELVRRMEANPGLGLLQTLPGIVRADTLFARFQQFANRLYGPVFGWGLAAWHGAASNFWGHNAIIRVEAFASSAHLPILSGEPPFGGHVISHDFIEAALLRRAGWQVRLAPDIRGSYEEAPPSMSDVIIRDRRWCQGNLQHSRFLFARGLSLASRLHILSGMMAYLSALFWCLLLVTGLLLSVQASLTRPDYFSAQSLFPVWPVFDSARAISLFILSMGIVLLPKCLGLLGALLSSTRRRAFGGGVVVTMSVLVESLFSVLVAPVMMLAQSYIVVQILRGSDSGWQPQQREGGGVSFTGAVYSYRWYMLAGVFCAMAAAYLHWHLFFWLLPVTAGLMLAGPLVWLSGSGRAGQCLRTWRVWLTPEERRQPLALSELKACLARDERPSPPQRWTEWLRDDALMRWHCAQLGPDAVQAQDSYLPARILAEAKLGKARDLVHLSEWLERDEAMALLSSPRLVRTMMKNAPGSGDQGALS